MKQNKLFKLWLLAVILFAGSGVTWGQTTFTWNFGTSSGVAAPSSGSLANLTVGNVSIGNTNGTVTMLSTTSTSSTYTGASGSYNAGNAARIGDLSTGTNGSAYFEFTLTPASGYSISLSSISFGSRGTTTAPVSYTLRSSVDSYASDITSGTLSANSTWALKSNTGLTFSGSSGTAITFRLYGYGGAGTPGANTINWRIDDLSIVVSLAGGTPTVATPTFTPAAGSYYTPQNVTLSSTTDGAAIYYTTDGTDPNNTGNGTLYSTPISVSATTTIKAKAYASSYDPSSIASATYTFPTINEVANIAALRAITLPSTEVYKLTGEALLSFKTSSRNAKYIQDASGGILIDDNAGNITTIYNIGDGITGITGTLTTYLGMLQFVPIADPGVASTTGNTVTPVVTTLDNLANYPGQLVKVTGLTIVETGNFAASISYTLSDGTNTGELRTAYSDLPYIRSAIPTVPQDITGVVLMYNTTAQLVPRTAADFTNTPITTPSIFVAETTIPEFSAFTGFTDTETINVSGAALTDDILVTITGTNASLFRLSTATIAQTDGIASGQVTITYSPTAAGSHSATLTLSSTGATSVTRDLTGTATVMPTAPDVIITEVYGGGGNSGATLKNDFIELYNTTESPVNISGWSVQYYSATRDGKSTNVTVMSQGSIIPPKSHFLIQQTGGSGGTDYLFEPDAIGTISMAATAGKVILYNTNEAQTISSEITSITGNANFMDYVPFGTTAVPVWGSAMAATTNTTSATRKKSSGTYVYTQNIGNDFEVVDPTPQNTGKFRSKATGNWADLASWEFTDNGTWADATVIPNNLTSKAEISTGHEITVAAAATASALKIMPAGKLTVPTGQTLAVAGNLTIESDATNGTGTVVDKGTLTVSGTTTINQAVTNLPRTYYMASPINGTATVAGFTKYATFDEPTDSWSSTLSEITDNQFTATPGQGYLIQVPVGEPATTNISFTGALNTGDKTVGLTASNKKFNFLGNPYPSYLDGQKVVDASTNVEKSIWYRTKGDEGNTYSFATYNVPTETSIPATAENNGFIPPMQGFWLKATAAGTYSFTNTMRTHNTTGTVIPLKAPQAKVNQILRLQISNGTALDETVVLFNENATTGYDSYDASKMMNTGTGALNIYTIPGMENLVLNSMPSVSYDVEIPVGMKLAAGTYSVSIKEFSNFADGTIVLLIDKQTGAANVLNNNNIYEFTLTEAMDNADRFALVFPQNAPTGVDNAGAGDVTVFTRSSRIVVTANEAAQGSMIYVFNGVGQRLAAQTVNGSVNEIGRSFPAGVYVVKVNNHTAKVVVK